MHSTRTCFYDASRPIWFRPMRLLQRLNGPRIRWGSGQALRYQPEDVVMEEASIARRPACRPERTGIGDARDSGGALIVSFRRKMTLSQDAASRPP